MLPYIPSLTRSRLKALLRMNAGAMLAHGEVLLFQHAATLMPLGALDMVREALADPQVLGGAFAIRFDQRGWMYERMGRDTSRRSVNGSYTGDQCIFVRRAAFWRMGGYPQLEIMEDVELADTMRRRGPVRLIPTPVVTSARRHRQCGLINVLLLCWRIRLLYALGVSDRTLKRMYPDVR